MSTPTTEQPSSTLRQVSEGTFTALIASLDTDALRRGKQFERIVKWWLQNDPARSRNIKAVWLWDEWEDRPGRDIGVDLVAELLDGTLCAIQAKCYDAERDIPKSEIDSFISAASPRTFAQRWLVATTNGLSANARRTIHDNHVTFVPLTELDAAAVTWPSNPDSLRAARKPGKAKPRPHQQRAIRDVLNGLETNSRGQLIMACGTGKTLTALWITERLEANTTLVLVPSLNLLSQTLTEWAHNTQRDWTYICVCSDDTVNKEDDQPINTTVDLPYPVTTKPSEIAHFLKSKGRKIVFSTYQSSAQVAKAQKLSGKKFDLTICDEAHRLTGSNKSPSLEVLDNARILSRRRLFMTATPRVYRPSNRSLAETFGRTVISMDDSRLFGPIFHRLGFAQAIELGLLADYRLVITLITDKDISRIVNRRALLKIDKSLVADAGTIAAQLGLLKAIQEHKLRRILTFHSRISRAESFAKQIQVLSSRMPRRPGMPRAVSANFVSGVMTTAARRAKLAQLRDSKSEPRVLSNSRCLSEGVDVPQLDGVAFIDPKFSHVEIVQAVGRAIRTSGRKQFGFIIVPVHLGDTEDLDSALEDRQFSTVWSVISALKSHDESLTEQLARLRFELGHSSRSPRLPNQVLIDSPNASRQLLQKLDRAVAIKIVENNSDTWDFYFGCLVKFFELHGHSLVTNSSDRELAKWIRWQRWSYRNQGQVYPKTRVAKLEQTIPDWTWDADRERWNIRYRELKSFYAQHGHCWPDNSPKYAKLRAWVSHQRRLHKQSIERASKTRKGLRIDVAEWKQRASLLENIQGWKWQASSSPELSQWDELWHDQFNNLLEYQRKFGHTNPPQRGKFASLGAWVNSQRGKYKRGALSADRVKLLGSLVGWTWSVLDATWERNFFELKAHATETGSCVGPYRTSQLAAWVTQQRSTYLRNGLHASRVRRLNSLPNWEWKLSEAKWMSQFVTLKTFNEKHGHCKVPATLRGPSGRITTWMESQRRSYQTSRSKLGKKRISMLEHLSGWEWDPTAVAFAVRFKELTKFSEEHGHCRVPKSDKYRGLYGWVSKQRRLWKTSKLPSTRRRLEKLNQLQGWSFEPDRDNWQTRFSELRTRLREDGTLKFTRASDPQLYAWVYQQKKKYRSARSKLTSNQIRQLEGLPGWKRLVSRTTPASRTKSVPRGRRNQ